MVNIKDIVEILSTKGIKILPWSLELYNQGESRVFKVDSNRGSLIIKVYEQSNKKRRLQKAEKEFYMSQLLAKHLGIPTMEFYAYGRDSKDNAFTVQKFAAGKTLREEKCHVVHLRHLAKIIARLHQINLEGSGDIYFRNGKPFTTHKSWHNFLLHSSYRSLVHMSELSNLSTEEINDYKYKIRILLEKYKPYIIEGRLIHGDLIKENILIMDDRINAILDFEYSCVGDPAWDFAGPADHFQYTLLKRYLKEVERLGMKTDEKNFVIRRKILAVVKALVIADSFVENEVHIQFRFWWSKFCRLINEMV